LIGEGVEQDAQLKDWLCRAVQQIRDSSRLRVLCQANLGCSTRIMVWRINTEQSRVASRTTSYSDESLSFGIAIAEHGTNRIYQDRWSAASRGLRRLSVVQNDVSLLTSRFRDNWSCPFISLESGEHYSHDLQARRIRRDREPRSDDLQQDAAVAQEGIRLRCCFCLGEDLRIISTRPKTGSF